MKKWIRAMVVMIGLTATAGQAFAAGTQAGTVISNKATASYTIGASTLTADSNRIDVTVAEIINVTATWQDAAPGVNVSAGQTDRVTTFRVANTGNGDQKYTLTATGSGIGSDQFDPAVTAVYIDANGNSAYDAGTDTLYSSGTSTVAADGYLTVFVLSTMPSTTLNDGDTGNVRLTATSTTGTGAAGTVLAGQGSAGVDAVIGSSGGSASNTGTYVVSSITVALNKTVTVIDQFGGTQPIPGATLRYALTVTVAGNGTAAGLVVMDPIPSDTTYTAGSLKLNGTGLSDVAGDDAGDVGGTTAGTVTVTVGDLTSASPVQTITFDVTIN